MEVDKDLQRFVQETRPGQRTLFIWPKEDAKGGEVPKALVEKGEVVKGTGKGPTMDMPLGVSSKRKGATWLDQQNVQSEVRTTSGCVEYTLPLNDMTGLPSRRSSRQNMSGGSMPHTLPTPEACMMAPRLHGPHRWWVLSLDVTRVSVTFLCMPETCMCFYDC